MDDHLLLLELPVPASAAALVVKAGLDLAALDEAAARVDPAPTAAQKDVGNYRKGHVSWKGLPLTIETAKGEYRRGVAKDGTAWKTKMKGGHYGYIKRTESEADGDHLDIFLADGTGPGQHLDSDLVVVINQHDPDTGRFDEHKTVLGCVSDAAARDLYLSCYAPGWTGLGSSTALTVAQFKVWIANGDTSKALTAAALRKTAEADLLPREDAARAGIQEAVNACTDDEIDGICVYYHAAAPKLLIVDIMDWGTETVGKRIGEAAAKLIGSEHVIYHNEQPRPRGGAWVEIEREDEKAAAVVEYDCPHCGGTAHNGIPGTTTQFRGSGHCRDCDKGFSIVGLGLKPQGYKAAREKTAIYRPVLFREKAAASDDDHPFTVAVDLDGTLAQKEEPFDPKTIGKPRKRAVYWARKFHEAGARLIVFTVRGDTELVTAWLDEHDVPYDYVNENPNQPPNSSGKVFADLYWDDRAYNAEDPDEHGPTILNLINAAQEPAEKPPESGPVIRIERTVFKAVLSPDSVLEMLGDEGSNRYDG